MTLAPETRRGRPRSDAAEQSIIQAALDLLAEGRGASAITMSEIARRAGVGKDTLYRRWRSKDDLLLAALGSLYEPSDEHAEGPIRSVLIERVAELVARVHDERNQRIYRSVLTACEGHPILRERFYAEVIEPRREATRVAIRLAVKRGELRPGIDPDLLGAMLFSPLLAQTYEGRLRDPLRGAPRTVAARLVDTVLEGSLPVNAVRAPRSGSRRRPS